MSDVEKIIERLLEVFQARNTVQLAEMLGIGQSTISQWRRRGAVPDKSIANASNLTGVSFSWLKTGEGEKGAERKPLDKELLQVIIEAVEEGLDQLNLELKPDKKAELIIHIYEMYEEEKQVDKPTILRLIRLAA